MTKELFIPKQFKSSSLEIIRQANAIIGDYERMGFTLTLRQLYYQFVSKDLLPNKQSEYKRLGSIINDARLAGLIDWAAIEDRTRNLKQQPKWDDPAEILRAVAEQYREDIWDSQEYRPEVWIEKDALIGVIEPICNEMRVPFFACRGYTSQSEQYSAGKRFAGYRHNGYIPLVLHLGDHDPSGLDMTRDNESRLSMFARSDVEVRRLALNMNQIEEYNPPPNPAKETDSRFEDYREQFGDESWELDALDPRVISNLIQEELDTVIDLTAWEARKQEEEDNRNRLGLLSSRWDDVTDFLDNLEADE